ncbi:MAG: hypothetical protein HWD60_16340 [Defluviicoccus sp.]|nr:MAG: hypothetical protein HWD60_16340 [Defluviicoccus sp.]
MSAATNRPTPSTLFTDAERLVHVLERENAALAAHDDTAVARLLAEKQAACAALEDAVRGLPDAGASRLALGALGVRLRRAGAENQRRLSAGIAARKRFLELVAAAVREQNAGAGIYARSGAPAHGRNRGTTVAPSALSFDQSL